MAKTNTKTRVPRGTTHEGAPAARITPEQELRRAVCSCLLWEDTFYESGVSIADRIQQLATQCKPEFVAALAIEARSKFHLRHVPLLLLTALAKTASGIPGLGQNTVCEVIQRPDEIPELLAVYAKANGYSNKDLKTGRMHAIKLPAQFKKGIARAFQKFNEYQLQKWDREGDYTLKYAMRGVHPTPANPMQGLLWGKLLGKKSEATGERMKLAQADTVMTALSAGAEKKTAEDKKTAFERLLREGKMGHFALLKNLRGMDSAGVDRKLIISALENKKGASGVLPFRYISAARAAPSYEQYIDKAMAESVKNTRPLSGLTWVLVDVSGSMDARISNKSEVNRIDAACSIAVLVNGDRRVASFSNLTVEVPARSGMAGIEAIKKSQYHSGTMMGSAVKWVNDRAKPEDRLIIITDEQSADSMPEPVCDRCYMVNVGSYRNGVGYHGKWTHIDGFSEAVLEYISVIEEERAS